MTHIFFITWYIKYHISTVLNNVKHIAYTVFVGIFLNWIIPFRNNKIYPTKCKIQFSQIKCTTQCQKFVLYVVLLKSTEFEMSFYRIIKFQRVWNGSISWNSTNLNSLRVVLLKFNEFEMIPCCIIEIQLVSYVLMSYYWNSMILKWVYVVKYNSFEIGICRTIEIQRVLNGSMFYYWNSTNFIRVHVLLKFTYQLV